VTRAALGHLGFALIVGVVFGLSPQTSTHPRYSLIGGGLAAAATFAFCRWRARGRSEPARFATLARPAASVWLALAAAGAVFAPTVVWLVDCWRENIFHNSHGIFVPLLMAMLARARLRRDPDAREESSAAGFAFVAAGLALAVLDAGLRTRYLAAVGVVLFLPGLSLLLLGRRRTRALALPLALGIFLLPVPNVLASPLGLREATAIGMARVLHWLGVPALVDDTLFVLPGDAVYLVSDNCAGFQLLLAGLAMATLLAFTGGSRARTLGIFAMVLPLVVLANVLRSALLLALTFFVGPHVLQVALVHGGTGVLAFWLVVFGLLALADRRALAAAFA
jgi:exosortase